MIFFDKVGKVILGSKGKVSNSESECGEKYIKSGYNSGHKDNIIDKVELGVNEKECGNNSNSVRG